MKRVICFLLCICLIVALPGCKQQVRALSCEEVAAAYEGAGYSVFHEHPAEDQAYDCYLKAENGDGEYLFIYFFPTSDAAEEHAAGRKWNAVLWLFSAVMGEPTWIHTVTYGTVVVEYEDKELYEPFEDLISS